MSDAAVTLDQVLERAGFIGRWEARGEARGEERAELAIARNMINMGLPLETIVAATRLDSAKVQSLYQQQ